VAASIAANVAHSFIQPAGTVGRWSPPVGAIIAAGFWPLALVISIEVISRVRWPGRWYWPLVRFGGLATVAVIAAIISYRHLSGLLRAYREDRLSATIGPLAVDGLMVICSAALLAIGANQRATPDTNATATPAPAPTDTETATADPPDNGTPEGTATPPDAGSGVPASGPGRTGARTARPRPARTDAQLLAALAQVPRDADGTVPVRRAAAALSTGPDRARRLLADAGLLRTRNRKHKHNPTTTSSRARRAASGQSQGGEA